MDLGFETIGNATLIVYDRNPVLVTDPWIRGSAYFGSWSLQHEIPAELLEAIAKVRFVWFSHGHPDHLNPESAPLFKDKQILLPDHVGGRIAGSLRQDGYHVTVLADNVWTQLSERVHVRCLADRNQDAVLLVDVGGRLVVDVNDAQDRGSSLIRDAVRHYPISFLLRLSGYGGADMMNFYDEAGHRLPSPARIRKDNGYLVGQALARMARAFGTTYVVPFSSMHRYQRSDSAWANETETHLEDYAAGFVSDGSRLLPAYIRYDCAADTWEPIAPREIPTDLMPPIAFGDVASDELERDEFELVRQYFLSFERIRRYLSFINVRVGGKDNVIEMEHRHFDRGVTFEVPRNSLLSAVKQEIFDDLLLGNFMKTTLHGRWPKTGLYPHFTPYVAKYGDNGRAHTAEELKAYFTAYRRRMTPFNYLRGELEHRAAEVFRAGVPRESASYKAARDLYWTAKAHLKTAPVDAFRAGQPTDAGDAEVGRP